MKINQKIISGSLLWFVGAQLIFVGGMMFHYYLSLQKELPNRSIQSIECYQNEVLYGVIGNNAMHYPAKPIQDGPDELKIYLIGAAVGTSGDAVAITMPM